MCHGEVGMVDPDRYCAHGCQRHTVVWWSLIREVGDPRPDREWFLCGVCSDLNDEALVSQGWVRVADEREPVPVREGVA